MTEKTMLATREVSLLSRAGVWHVVAVTFFVAVQVSIDTLITQRNWRHTQGFSERARR